ncbi:hypothetical protein EVAR_55029_1 [Eumeta japonica]|uniref:Peptidase A2 domain-containing protein n=1 Tax=Eumeta variegata TaxID=151549 RepID=A0A4C1ZUJ2_EUMVA|nr:hypothetical protein EVAR_55029_1 [Eumeta japonica]
MAVQGKAHRRMSPTSCKLKTRRHHGSTRKKFGRPEQLVDEVLKEVKVMSRLTDSGREINDFAITTRNCVALTNAPARVLPCEGCAKCNRGHHTLLHPSTGSDARPARAAPNESAVSETVTNIGTGESKALLKIVPVTIRAADREIKVHALLDDGATVTLLDDSVASHINAKAAGRVKINKCARSPNK